MISDFRTMPEPEGNFEGRVLGAYRVVREIGSGGMGLIYEAYDNRLRRRVALKLLPIEYNRDAGAKKRFRREARAASALDHPNICNIHDIGESEQGRLFIVMAYYEGQTLRQRLEQAPLPLEEAVELAVQVARGLERAHESGIIHRDIKPANVMLTRAAEAPRDQFRPDRAKILDFGIARTAGEDGLTATGGTLGTPHYMSPEQVRGERIDQRTDIWSLGVMLFEMLTGRLPFEGVGPVVVANAIANDDPEPLSRLLPEAPEGLTRTVERMLRKDPGERPTNVTEILAALESLGAADQAATEVLAPRPLIKTLLMTDLVDSTQLSRRLGDRRLAEVSAAHDRLARDLLAEFGGLEIDKTDGFLSLFERPIDAVRCALAYQRRLGELSEEVDAELMARAGIHLGEVYLRRNPPEDVARGAKPIEVEGLAKPLAARIMSLAGARQILLTQSAFDLARRATADAGSAGDAGPAGEPPQWVAHGPYLFKGVDEPIETFEVGVDGFAPLRAPADSGKARRAVRDGEIILGWRAAVGQPLPGRPHWVLSEKLGEGGFGEVWLACHDKTGERHALKFCYEHERLKALQREVTLFRLMKEALGRREDIVRILDWNFDEAPYYIESEYTAGGDLVSWAESQGGLASIPLARRLELVAQVAEALSAAHSIGILHKDIKPANILIAEDEGGPRARLTDFGVGMLTDRSVLAGSAVTVLGLTENMSYTSSGTQLYMAPEILEGKVASVEADVYALGVVLYQVAAGDFSHALARGWQRDVDDDVLRDDIACFVDGSPRRRPANAAEIARRLRALESRRADRQAREQARRALERGRHRRKWLVAALVVMAFFAAAMTYQMGRTQEAARRAEREAEAARQALGFLEGLFRVSDPGEARGNTVTAREILDQGAEQIEQELAGQPEIQARMMNVMGVIHQHLGQYDTARRLLEGALETRRSVHGMEHPEVAESLHSLARLLFLRGEHKRAEALWRDALEMRRESLGKDHPDLAETLCELSNVLIEKGQIDEAETFGKECLGIRRQHFGEPHDKVAETLFTFAVLEHFRDTAAAEGLYREALEMYESLYGELHPAVGEVLNNYAYLLRDRGDMAAAEPMFRRSLEINQRVFDESHAYIAVGQNNLAIVLIAQGEHAEAEELARRAEASFRENFGESHWHTAIARSALGASLAGQKKFEEAEPLLVASYPVIREQRGNDFNYAGDALDRLVAFYEAWDRPEQASTYRELRETLDP